jgi:hypothetical protein
MYRIHSYPCTEFIPTHAPSPFLPMYRIHSYPCTKSIPTHVPNPFLPMHQVHTYPCTESIPTHVPNPFLPVYRIHSYPCAVALYSRLSYQAVSVYASEKVLPFCSSFRCNMAFIKGAWICHVNNTNYALTLLTISSNPSYSYSSLSEHFLAAKTKHPTLR